jgi:hypothetical protein
MLRPIERTAAQPRVSQIERKALPIPWSPEFVQAGLMALCRRTIGSAGIAMGGEMLIEALTAIARRAEQLTVQTALRERKDLDEAIADLAIGYAFAQLVGAGLPFHKLDLLSQTLVQRTLQQIYGRAERLERSFGENPLDEDPGLLLSLCRSLADYTPHKPVGGHIAWKLAHYEGAVSRAMRQIENLVRTPAVTEAFVAFVLGVELPAEIRQRLEETGRAEGVAIFKARLAAMARGGGREKLDPVATIRFFALPATVAFVRQFAATVQPARTLYVEAEYAGLTWQGKRSLPQARRQGYLEAALWQLERQQQATGRALLPREDAADDPEERELADPAAHERVAGALRSRSFACWVVETALERRPDDPLWRAGELRYVRGLTTAEIVAAGLADAATLAAVTLRIAELEADDDLWQGWLEATLAA